MQLHQIVEENDDDEDVEEEEDGATSTDTELVEAYYDAMGHIAESVDFLESAVLTLPRKRQLRKDIEEHLTKVRDFLEEQGFTE